LVAFQTYRRDNQEFVLDYLQEVKPYHVQVKQFDLVYDGFDDYLGTLTDFDNPSRWDIDLEIPQFVSPILLPYDTSTAVGTGTPSDIADTASNATIWTQLPWSQWYGNYLLAVQEAYVSNPGSGYTVAPQVEITGTCVSPAVMTAVINSAGQVVGIDIVDPGFGYTTTAVLTLTGGNGVGATAYSVMGGQGVGQDYSDQNIENVDQYYNLVRSIRTTIKYDRYQYNSDITDWSYLVPSYPADTQVRYNDSVWQAIAAVDNPPVIVTATGQSDSKLITVSSTVGIQQGMLVEGFNIQPDTHVDAVNGSTVLLTRVLLNDIANTVKFYNIFDPEQWSRVASGSLSGIDRTQGYYLPGPNLPGRSLPLVIDGLDYPGVQVTGVRFNQNTGFDVGNYDINPFDNIAYGPEGRPTYDPAILDAIYESNYLDIYLGTRPTDINVDGGAYVDTYESHAPEELVPGIEFDTLDLRVYTDDPTTADFRIFQDMRGIQAAYRITADTTTYLVQPLSAGADIVYVNDVTALNEPNFDANIWGVLTVNGERIMYRYRDTVNNTVSGLLRGTAGTATSNHKVNAIVYNLSIGNLLPTTCQDYYDVSLFLADGSTLSFVSLDINYQSTLVNGICAAQVFVGGILLTSGYTLTANNYDSTPYDTGGYSSETLGVVLDVAPPDGVEVTLQVRRGHSWYNPLTPALPLSETTTNCARFIRGEI
jgi:hypothetical protein